MLTVRVEDKNLNIRFEPKGRPSQMLSIPAHLCEGLSSQIDEALGITAPETGEKENVQPKSTAPTAPAPSAPKDESNSVEHEGAGDTEASDTDADEDEGEEESDDQE